MPASSDSAPTVMRQVDESQRLAEKLSLTTNPALELPSSEAIRPFT